MTSYLGPLPPGGNNPNTYVTADDFASLPSGAAAGSYGLVGDTLYRKTASNGWAPPAFYSSPTLTEILKIAARDLELDDADPVASWGGLTAAGSGRPAYNSSGGPGDGPWVDFNGSAHRMELTTTAAAGQRRLVFAVVVKPDAVNNHCVCALGNSVAILQLQLANSVRHFLRTRETPDGAATAIVSATAPSTSDWSVIVGVVDYTGDEAEALVGDDGNFVRDVPVPQPRAGRLDGVGIVTTGVIEGGSKTLKVANNTANSTAFNGGLAYLGLWGADGAVSSGHLEALGELAWIEATG